jgi:Holliday junction resolvase-like predicted endonuclease
VKYRRNANQGSGLEYVTSKKLEQMRFAAENWVAVHD